MPQPYFPRADAAALSWMQNFAHTLESAPDRYRVVAQDTQAIRAAVNALAPAYGSTSFEMGSRPPR